MIRTCKEGAHILKQSDKAKNVKIETAVDLWDAFEKASNLQKDFYDKELEKQIREKLSLPDTVSIRKNLEQKEIPVEKLLMAILTAMQPFSQMMRDLLKMFEKASAGQGDYNLRIHMEFGSMDDTLDFDLENFRQYEKMTEQACRIVETQIPKELWKMVNAYRRDGMIRNKTHIGQDDICRWIEEYHSEDKWPDFVPERPSMGEPRLDKLTARCWDIFETAVAGYRQIYDEAKGRRQSVGDACDRSNRDSFWAAEQDCWTCLFLEAVAGTADKLQCLPIDKKTRLAEEIADDLERYFLTVDTIKMETMQIVDNLIEILNLPFWKKRYELYSAWVSTQIVEALGNRDIKFQVKDNTLSFSFGGSHFATCTGLCPPLEIWAELRTNAKNLVGNGRKNAIQPDYTLATSPVMDPDNTVVVVECKQYEKPNRKNFRDAIIDYAGGRPKAVIMLAGYGMVPQEVCEGIGDERIKSRAAGFSLMRPGSLQAKEFREKLRESVLEYYRNKAREDRDYLYPWGDLQKPCLIRLKWGEHPKDLDLHLRIIGAPEGMDHIYFKNRGNENVMPYAYLDKDVTQGWGPETIRISKWTELDYVVEVHDYSKNSKDVSFEVEVCCGQDRFCFQRRNLTGVHEWTVLRIGKSGIKEL